MEMSCRIQRALRQLIFSFHFQDPHVLKDIEATYALFVYASLPVSTSAAYQDGKLTLDTGKDIYWDWRDPNLRGAMVLSSITGGTLVARLQDISTVLQGLPELSSLQGFYQADQAGKMQQIIATTNSPGDSRLQSLLFVESQIISGVKTAANDILKFLRANISMPSDAIAALSKFGADATETFNTKLDVYTGDAIRPLGTLLFLEAAQALCPTAMTSESKALLDIALLKPGHPLPSLGEIPKTDIALEQRLMSFGP